MALGISYAAVDEETTAIIIQGVATGGVIIVAGVFTAAFYYSTRWLNKIHDIEHSVEPAKRRSLKPLGCVVEVKAAHMKHEHYLRADHEHDNTRLPSDSQAGDDQLDIPFLVMASADNVDGTNEDAVYLLDYIGGEMMKPFSTTHLREMTPAVTILLFLSSTSFLLGLMACKYKILPV